MNKVSGKAGNHGICSGVTDSTVFKYHLRDNIFPVCSAICTYMLEAQLGHC